METHTHHMHFLLINWMNWERERFWCFKMKLYHFKRIFWKMIIYWRCSPYSIKSVLHIGINRLCFWKVNKIENLYVTIRNFTRYMRVFLFAKEFSAQCFSVGPTIYFLLLVKIKFSLHLSFLQPSSAVFLHQFGSHDSVLINFMWLFINWV